MVNIIEKDKYGNINTIIFDNKGEYFMNKNGVKYFYNPYTNETSWTGFNLQNKKLDLKNTNLVAFESKQYPNNVYFIDNDKITWKIPFLIHNDNTNNDDNNDDNNCNNLQGLEWIDNSCYADSVLQLLLSISNNWIYNLINIPIELNNNNFNICNKNSIEDIKIRNAIKEELKNIHQIINKEKNKINQIGSTSNIKINNIKKLRNLFKNCRTSNIKWFSGGQQDAGEFILYLFSILDYIPKELNKELNKDTSNKNKKSLIMNVESINITYATNSLSKQKDFNNITNTVHKYNDSIVQFINYEQLRNDKKYISNYIENWDDILINWTPEIVNNKLNNKLFNRKITYNTILNAPILFFIIARNNPILNKIDNTIIIADPELIINPNNILEFVGMVIYEGSGAAGHYTTYFKCSNYWYYYNDLEITEEKITLVDLNKINWNNLYKKAILYYYVDKNINIKIPKFDNYMLLSKTSK